MDKKGPIVLIDDDDDDLQLLIEIFADMNLSNEVHLFRSTASVMNFLQRADVNPFLIISDINMPVMNGFELRDAIAAHPELAKKKIPYLFFSTLGGLQRPGGDQSLPDQGIFRKPSKKSEWREVLETIVKYWSLNVSGDIPAADHQQSV